MRTGDRLPATGPADEADPADPADEAADRRAARYASTIVIGMIISDRVSLTTIA